MTSSEDKTGGVFDFSSEEASPKAGDILEEYLEIFEFSERGEAEEGL